MRVLCAVDGSLDAHLAIETLQGLGAGPGSSLDLLHVIDTALIGISSGMEALELPEERGRAIVDRAAKEYVSSRWRTVEKRIVRGRPAETILRAAGSVRAELVVVGCRGVSTDPSFLLGSVSRRLVLYAPCAVLVTKKCAGRPRLAIVGLDGSADARGAVEFVLRLPLAQDIRVLVASVIPPLPMPSVAEGSEATDEANRLRESLQAEANQMVGQEARRLRDKGYDAGARVLHGPAGPTLVALAESTHADLVVVGSHGLAGARQFLMGSVSETVTTYAPCAVLVWRPTAGASAASRDEEASS